jgi:hypothetical protein
VKESRRRSPGLQHLSVGEGVHPLCWLFQAGQAVLRPQMLHPPAALGSLKGPKMVLLYISIYLIGEPVMEGNGQCLIDRSKSSVSAHSVAWQQNDDGGPLQRKTATRCLSHYLCTANPWADTEKEVRIVTCGALDWKFD